MFVNFISTCASLWFSGSVGSCDMTDANLLLNIFIDLEYFFKFNFNN